MVIAWRVMLMTLLGREVPDLPTKVLFSDLEIEVLTAFANSRRALLRPGRWREGRRTIGGRGGVTAPRRSEVRPRSARGQ